MYHFRCTKCEKMKEQKLSFGSKDVPVCESCKKPMVKVIVPPMVHFKGAGFYKTDSNTSKEKAVPKAPDPPAPAKPSSPSAS